MNKLISIVVVALVACGGRGLNLTMIDASVQRPSNVAVYFTVDTAEGEPVPGLNVMAFKIYEDGQPISSLESRQTILNPEVSASHFTLLLIDMSGSVTGSGDVPVIVEAAKGFSQRVEKFQKVSIYAFDGSPNIRQLGGPDQLSSFSAKDPSTNLNGAIVEGIKVLHQQMSSSSTPLTFGTLVVFTDGTDRAGRVPRDQLYEQLDHAGVDILTIGVGAEIDGGELRSIGKNGSIVNKDRAQISASFEAAAARVEAMSNRYYLLGYCSPARAGKHTVRIETNANGKTGSLEYEFDAKGFGPNCDPNRPPSFNVKRPKRVAFNFH